MRTRRHISPLPASPYRTTAGSPLPPDPAGSGHGSPLPPDPRIITAGSPADGHREGSRATPSLPPSRLASDTFARFGIVRASAGDLT